MSSYEMIRLLWQWTPYLLGGFVYNLLISVLAMLLGTLIGVALGAARSTELYLRMPATWITGLCRNVPSFVLMFYLAFILPVEFYWNGSVYAVPLWIKAALALTIPVVGFTSDQSLAYRRQSGHGEEAAGAIFLVAWVQYLLIVLMASATASVIGASDAVGRVNEVIAINSSQAFLLLAYGYVCVFFLVSGLAINFAAQRLEDRLRANGTLRGSGRKRNATSPASEHRKA